MLTMICRKVILLILFMKNINCDINAKSGACFFNIEKINLGLHMF